METEDVPDNTPLINGNVVFSKLRKLKYTSDIVNKLIMRNDPPTEAEIKNWRKLIERLKVNEGHRTFFKPVTDYECFNS